MSLNPCLASVISVSKETALDSALVRSTLGLLVRAGCNLDERLSCCPRLGMLLGDARKYLEVALVKYVLGKWLPVERIPGSFGNQGKELETRLLAIQNLWEASYWDSWVRKHSSVCARPKCSERMSID
eukprot:5060600-Karenia_brevis.AAC.1